MTITYLFASVTAYTLGRTRLSDSGSRLDGYNLSPHCQEYEAEGQDEDEIVPFQLGSSITPGFRLGIEPSQFLTSTGTHVCMPSGWAPGRKSVK